MNGRWIVTVVLLLALALQGVIVIVPTTSISRSWQILPMLIFLLAVTLIIEQSLFPSRKAEPSKDVAPAEPKEASAEDAYIYNARRYGIGYGLLEVESYIDAADGSARVRRNVVVEAYSEVAELDTYLMIPEEAPEGSRSLDFVEARSITDGYDLSLEVMKGPGQVQYAQMSISPQLSDGDVFEYEMIEELPPGLYAIDLTEEELEERKTPFEYFGWHINRPTRELSLSVFFPEHIRPKVYGIEVHFAAAIRGIPKRSMHPKEKARLERLSLKGPVAGSHYHLKQRVKYPMVGLVYVLRWEPLTTEGRNSTGKRT